MRPSVSFNVIVGMRYWIDRAISYHAYMYKQGRMQDLGRGLVRRSASRVQGQPW